jgi:hypothetical protein
MWLCITVHLLMLNKFCVPVKLVRLIKMCLNETCSKVRVGKHLSDRFPGKNEMFYRHCFSTLL